MQSNVVRLDELETPISMTRPIPDEYPFIGQIKDYLKQRGFSQAEFGRRIGYSSSVISQYLKGIYGKTGGDLKEVNEALTQFFESEALYTKYQTTVAGTVVTSQVREILGAIKYVERHRSFGVIVGEAGIGKNKGLEEYQRTHRQSSLLLTMNPLNRTATSFVQTLWRKIPGHRSTKTMPKSSFLVDDIIHYFNNLNKTILINEAQFLNEDALEVARSIQDQANVGFILAGTFDIDHAIGFDGPVPENAQLYRRVRVHCVVNPTITPADAAAICALHNVDDSEIMAWLFDRCNYVGRRYSWIVTMIQAAHDFTIDMSVSLTIQTMQAAAKLTGLRY